MAYASGQLRFANRLLDNELVENDSKTSNSSKTALAKETAMMVIAAVLVIRFIVTSPIAGLSWFLAPSILVIAALVPTALRKDKFADICFNFGNVKQTLLLTLPICGIVFTTVYLASWTFGLWGLRLPLQAELPNGSGWLSWILYQFLYVAVAEEVFFRGYLQSNILKLARAFVDEKQSLLSNWISIILSAACFAVAHVIVQGQITAVVTFLPGLILGWLFIRTGTLFAPIMFHGLANATYCMMAYTIA